MNSDRDRHKAGRPLPMRAFIVTPLDIRGFDLAASTYPPDFR